MGTFNHPIAITSTRVTIHILRRFEGEIISIDRFSLLLEIQKNYRILNNHLTRRKILQFLFDFVHADMNNATQPPPDKKKKKDMYKTMLLVSKWKRIEIQEMRWSFGQPTALYIIAETKRASRTTLDVPRKYK